MFWNGKINIVKMTIPPKAIYKFNAILSSYQRCFSQNENKDFIICMETQSSQSNLKKNGAGGIRLSDFSPYYRDRGIRTV